MSNSKVFVGIDYHLKKIQVCVVNSEGLVLKNSSIDNEMSALLPVLARYGPVGGIAIESCSGAAALADELVTKHDFVVDLAHPGFVSRMRLNPDKTDYSDARILADLERVGYLPSVWLAPHEVREMRRLVRYRQQLVNERRNSKLRIRAMLRDQRVKSPRMLRPWTNDWMMWLEQIAVKELSEEGGWIVQQLNTRLSALRVEIRKTEQRLAERTETDTLVQTLKKIDGIGPVTAWTLRAEVGRFDRFRSGKQLARFCGLSPRNASSGARQADAGLIRAANGQLRATLIEAAHRLMRHNPKWREFADRLRGKSKPYCLVAAAVGNRWIRSLYHEMKGVAA